MLDQNTATEENTLLPCDLAADRREVVAELWRSGEMDRLTSAIDVRDLSTIVTFGQDAAKEVSGTADRILRELDRNKPEDAEPVMAALMQVMTQFDTQQITGKASLWGKLFGGQKAGTDDLLRKYERLGEELDRVYIRLRGYEHDILRYDRQLDALYSSQTAAYRNLVKYSAAGEQGVREIAEYVETLKQEENDQTDVAAREEVEVIRQAQNLLELRTRDLLTAENVSLQTIPMIRMIQITNRNLLKKMRTALIVTIPTFRQALSKTMDMKRKELQDRAMSALNRRVNAELRAQNTPVSDCVRTLEQTRETILEGIREAEGIRVQAARQMDESRKKLADVTRNWHK